VIILVFSQTYILPQQQKVNYRILGISVEGNKSTDPTTIIANTGLKVGDELEIPSDQTVNAIKRLWNLGIFEDVQLLIDKKIDTGIFLRIKVKEYPRLEKVGVRGNDELSTDDILKKVTIVRGQSLKPADIYKIKNEVKNLYVDDGYLNAVITPKQFVFANADTSDEKITVTWVNEKDSADEYETEYDKDQLVSINSIDRIKDRVVLLYDIDEGKEVTINKIEFIGNKAFDNDKLKSQFDETEEPKWWKFWSSPKFKRDKFKDDEKLLEKFYRKNGYIDFVILGDSIAYSPDKTKLDVIVKVYEGPQYKVRNINIEGNTVYPDQAIMERLDFKKGDVFDLEKFNNNLHFNEKQSDVSSMYQDNGFLLFNIDTKETRIMPDSIDLDIKITENNRFKIGKVDISGNDKTMDKVIRRELYTVPGDYFSRAMIIRSIQQLANLQYFNAEELYKGVNYQPKNDSTVDISYKVQEKSSDYLNASVGYSGAFGFSGAIGFTLTNFSLEHPFSMGGGQMLNFNWQFGVGNYYRTFSLGFTEPWFMDTPTSIGFNMFDTRQRYVYDLRQSGISFQVGRRLKWPDDYFYIQGEARFQYNDVLEGLGIYAEGLSRQYTTGLTISRTNIDDPVFPTQGSKVSLSGEISGGPFLPGNVDYYKLLFNAEFYKPLFGTNRIVLYSGLNLGYIKELESGTPIQPFDFFYMGGNGLIIATVPLRGYEDRSIGPRNVTGDVMGSRVMEKMTIELRASLAREPIPIYLLAFAEAGNVFLNLKQTDPFDLKRSAGIGARILINPIGLLGFDYGYGFDRFSVDGQKPQWVFHFQFGKGF